MDPRGFGSLDLVPDLDTRYCTETNMRIRNKCVLINHILIFFKSLFR
jgi:hypothetical protein